MKRREFAQILLGGALTAGAGLVLPAQAAGKKRVLAITHAAGFRHDTRDLAAETVKQLGDETGQWEVVAIAPDQAAVQSWTTPDKLKGLDMVFFAKTTGDLGMTADGKTAFYDWIRRGGAYAGVHSAGDTYHGDAQYLDLVRGEFQTHGAQQTVEIFNQDPKHPACKDLPASFSIHDEIYEFKNWDRAKVHVLLSMHKHPQRDEKGDFPVAWTNRLGKGRMFYTSLGHRSDVYPNPLYRKHLTGGLQWALGLAKGDDKPGNPII